MAMFNGSSGLPEFEPVGPDEPTRRVFVRAEHLAAAVAGETEPRPSHVAPTFAGQAEAHLQAALGASVRTEARLGSLLRAVQHFSAGISHARDANDELARELDRLRELLETSSEQQAELRHRVGVLEQAMARAEQHAAREREFLIDQQDAFIRLLCSDQERELSELLEIRLERDQLRGDLGRVQAQRDEAQAAVVRIASERDQALIELSRTRSHDRNRPPQSVRSGEVPGHAVGRLELETLPRTESPSSTSSPRASATDSVIPQSQPVLKQKPDPSTRPLIGYSLAGDELPAEELDATKVSPRLPDR